MSQLIKYVGEAPVGAGIAALSGNGGFPGDTAVADGNNNVNIVGFGTIIVNRTGANTLTISSAGVPATYTTDAGIAVPDALGDLGVVGDANITTDAATPNTVTVSLNDNVHIVGNFIADGDITAAAGGHFNYVTVTTNGLEVTGQIIAHSIGRGVVQINNAFNMFADSGIGDGEVLISDQFGLPAWRTLTAGHAINIINAANSITIETNPALPLLFSEDIGNASAVGAPVGVVYVYGDGGNIHTTGDGAKTIQIELMPNIHVDSVTTSGAVDPGLRTGAGSSIQSGLDITSARDIIAGRDLTAGRDLNVNNTANTTELFVANTTTLNAQRNGVLQTNGAGLVQATNSNHILPAPPINGQVLISGPVAPAWNALTSADGSIVFDTTVANHIDLSATGGRGANLSSFFAFQIGNTPLVTGDTGGFYDLGSQAAFTTALPGGFNTGGNFFGGDGLGTPAQFNTPVNGTYYFNMQTKLFNNGPNLVPYIDLQISNITQGRPYTIYAYAHNVTGDVHSVTAQYSVYIQLIAGDVVRFLVYQHTNSPIPTASVVGDNGIPLTPITTFISGFKVA